MFAAPDRKKWVNALFISAVLAFPRTNFAQTNELATAESLFGEGRSLMQRGEYDKACAALLASSELDRALGTILNLARCYELSGKLASAWGLYSEVGIVAKRMNQAERSQVALERRDRLAHRVPYVVVTVAGADDEVEVEIDGEPLPHSALGVPFAIDAGTHVLVASATGKVSRTVAFDIPVREPDPKVEPTRVNLPALMPDGSSPAATSNPASGPIPKDEPLPSADSRLPGSSLPDTAEPSAQSTQVGRWLGVSALAVGLGAAGLGIGLGVDAVDHAEDADCDADDYCTPGGLATRDAAREQLRTANVIGVTGAGLALAGAATLLIVEWRSQSSGAALSSSLSPGSLGIRLNGRF